MDIDLKDVGYERVLTGSIWMMLIVCRMCDVVFECFDELRNYYFLKQHFATLNCEGVWRAVQK